MFLLELPGISTELGWRLKIRIRTEKLQTRSSQLFSIVTTIINSCESGKLKLIVREHWGNVGIQSDGQKWDKSSESSDLYETLQSVIESSVISESLRPHGLQPTRLLCPWNFPGKNTGMVCYFLLQIESYFHPKWVLRLIQLCSIHRLTPWKLNNSTGFKEK